MMWDEMEGTSDDSTSKLGVPLQTLERAALGNARGPHALGPEGAWHRAQLLRSRTQHATPFPEVSALNEVPRHSSGRQDSGRVSKYTFQSVLMSETGLARLY